MHPIICKLGPLTIHSYGLMMAVAFCVVTILVSRHAKTQGLNPELIPNLLIVLVVSGIIGARILFVILNLKFYLNNPVEIVMFFHGGLAWFGGFILASLAGGIYLRRKHLDVWRIFDMVIPYIALAQAIGRVGCFLNGCCFGKESLRFGLYFPVHDAVLIPTQLYSVLALLGIYIILRIRQLRIYSKGGVFYLYLLLYSSWRFSIEFFRGDSEIFVYGLTLFQIFSIALFVLSAVMLIRIRRKK